MTTAPVATTVELNVGGTTCASCAARIEKKLNRMPGVTASVNFATEKARVQLATGVDVADVVAAVEATGYTACRRGGTCRSPRSHTSTWRPGSLVSPPKAWREAPYGACRRPRLGRASPAAHSGRSTSRPGWPTAGAGGWWYRRRAATSHQAAACRAFVQAATRPGRRR